MKVIPIMKRQGYATSYHVTLGSAEVRAVGFAKENGERPELEKILIPEKHEIIIRIKQD